MTAFSQEELARLTYKYQSGENQIKSEAQYGYLVEKIEINNGIFSHVQGMQYPEKGVVTAKDIFATNMIKKVAIESLRLSKYLIPSLFVFVFVPFKFKIKIIERVMFSFNEIGFKIMSPSILQFQHLTPMAQELALFMERFLGFLGISNDIGKQFTEIIINIINFDNAYRYRIQDLFNETTKEKLSNPKKEIKRLVQINYEREVMEYPANEDHLNKTEDYKKKHWVKVEDGIIYSRHKKVSDKFKLFANLLSLLFLHPKIKKAYLKALIALDIAKVKPDTSDWFWMCIREGYQYFGKTKKQRTADINHLRHCIPTKL